MKMSEVRLTLYTPQHQRSNTEEYGLKKSNESTKMCDTAKIEHSTAKPCPYFLGLVYIIKHERAKQDKIFWVIWMLSGNQPVTDS